MILVPGSMVALMEAVIGGWMQDLVGGGENRIYSWVGCKCVREGS